MLHCLKTIKQLLCNNPFKCPCRKYYSSPDTQPSPHKYVHFPEPTLQALDVRLLAFLLAEDQSLAEPAIEAACDIFKAVPAGTERTWLQCTVSIVLTYLPWSGLADLLVPALHVARPEVYLKCWVLFINEARDLVS